MSQRGSANALLPECEQNGELGVQEAIVSCLEGIVEIERDKLHTYPNAEKGSHEVISQLLYGLISRNIMLTAGNSSHIIYVCASNIEIFDAFQHLLEQRSEERVEASFPNNFKCDYDDQHITVDFLVEANCLERYLHQIEEEVNSMRNSIRELWINTTGREMNFIILMSTKKGLRMYFVFCTTDHFARGCQTTFTLHPMLRSRISIFSTGMPLHELAYSSALLHVHRHFACLYCTLRQEPLNAFMVFAGPPVFPSNTPFMFAGLPLLESADDPYPQMLDDRKSKGDWSSLPDLLLWMIMDKLDIFDNTELAAVCRNWRSASVRNPKVLQSVGDGLPWIWQEGTDFRNSFREFISVPREVKLIIDLAEFRKSLVLFSKHGWILLQQRENFLKPNTKLPDSLLLINPFTRAKIKLPDVINPPIGYYAGSFSTREGCPDRVVLLNFRKATQVTISTVYPGNEVWTEHTYFGQRTKFSQCRNLIIMGPNVYCYDIKGRMIVYNVDCNSWKELPGCRSNEFEFFEGYVTEHEGAIMKIEQYDYNFRYFNVFVYNDANTVWERLDKDAVRDTSWYLCKSRNCFSVKEKGLKVYILCQKRNLVDHMSRDNVVLHDLITGSTQTLRLPYPVSMFANWVDIG